MGRYDERLPRRERMQTQWEFDQVRQSGEVYSGKYLLLSGLRCQTGRDRRIGFIVRKRLGNAVVRNRIKRWLREVYRKHRARLTEGILLVIIARDKARYATYHEVEDDFLQLLQSFIGGLSCLR